MPLAVCTTTQASRRVPVAVRDLEQRRAARQHIGRAEADGALGRLTDDELSDLLISIGSVLVMGMVVLKLLGLY